MLPLLLLCGLFTQTASLATPGAPQSPLCSELLELGGGTKLLYAPTAAAETFELCLRFHGGLGLAPANAPALAELCAALLELEGSVPGESLAGWLRQRNSELDVVVLADEIRLSYTVGKGELSQSLTRLASDLRPKKLPTGALTEAREQVLAHAALAAAKTAGRAEQVLERLAYHNDPLVHAAQLQSIHTLTDEALLEHWAEQFAPERLLIVAMGPFSAAEFATAWRATLADFSSATVAAPRAPRAFAQPKAGCIYLVHEPTAEASELRAFAAGPPATHADVAALELWSALLQNRIEVALGSTDTPLRWARAGYQFGATGAGRFEALWVARNAEVGLSLTWLLALLEEAQGGFQAEELERARKRLAEADGARSPFQRLMQEARPAWQGKAPPESQFALDPSALEQALARHFDPTRLLLLAVGPAELLREELRGKLTALPYEPLLERMLSVLGGRQIWADLRSLEVEIMVDTGGGAIVATKQWLDLELPRFRVELPAPAGPKIVILDEGRAFEATGAQVTEYPAEVQDTLVKRHRRSLWNLMHHLALGQGVAVYEDPSNQIHVTLKGEPECVLGLAADGRPARLTYQERGQSATLHYSNWQQSDGFNYATNAREEPTGRSWQITRFQPGTAFDPKHLKP